jgi:hypothetical protein
MSDNDLLELIVSRLLVVAKASLSKIPESQRVARVTPTRWCRTHWSSDSCAMGAYSYLPRGESEAIFDELARPESDCLWFAGEATQSSASLRASVGGAWLSGVRAAEELTKVKFKHIPITNPGVASFDV